MRRMGEKSEERLIELETRSRRNNVIFKGLRNVENNKCVEKVKEFCSEVLGITSEIEVNRAHLLGRGPSVIAHIPKDEHINKIFKNVRKLKNTNYVVHRDYPKDIRVIRARLLALKKAIDRMTNGIETYIGFDFMLVEEIKFQWSKDGNRLMAGTEDGAEKLKEMLRMDFTEQIQAITRGDRRRRPDAQVAGNEDGDSLHNE
ncbi:uncharacterized protein LOC120352396 [Nilaparvata lugens]|uniref:uncharacterized protein LOC120352396 n=1 Tax=Nilaparvata lugens TaxID=108931 RepID=UPI00193D870D|nr:uncharacterized protein LOC120352396 [Nilaparvata lugens]